MKLRIFVKAYDKDLLNIALANLKENLIAKNCEIGGVVALPTRIKRFCVLRSPHVDKDSREHFEMRISKRFLDVKLNTTEGLNQLLNLEFPAGVHCSVKLLNPIDIIN